MQIDVPARDLQVGDRWYACGADVNDKPVIGWITVDDLPIRREINNRQTGEFGHCYEVNVAFEDGVTATTIRYMADAQLLVERPAPATTKD